MGELSGHGMAALRDLYYRPGLYESVYADLRGTGERDVLPRWRALAAELARQGAGAGLVDRLRDSVLGAVPEPLRAEQVADEVSLTVTEQTASLLARFDEERRPGGRAVEGVAPTLEALRESLVAVLLIGHDPGTRAPHGSVPTPPTWRQSRRIWRGRVCSSGGSPSSTSRCAPRC